jgi:hypothetical protein
MPTTTPAQGFRIPVNTDDPDVVDDVTQLAKAIEKRVMGVYATTAARDSATAAAGVEEGMFAFTKDTNSVWYYDGAGWVKFPPTQPAITSGTTVPANSSGANGDVFFKV